VKIFFLSEEGMNDTILHHPLFRFVELVLEKTQHAKDSVKLKIIEIHLD
jgi:hypothetical protein